MEWMTYINFFVITFNLKHFSSHSPKMFTTVKQINITSLVFYELSFLPSMYLSYRAHNLQNIGKLVAKTLLNKS